ncbi:uncharacterized protein TM35_000011470 [Trypanosoma theileri]|uniref:Epsin n=1 Tax=Trypanosoma theileri TaxID=67003 RepID=A0A1X0P9Y7_9TRYP|nr:uncharacterized protein TM35_000011470 [Trypanosoma theileri]ORC93270.1 hypothetical protein TM35_000011470 [Trypanosoma theileri]
MDRGLFRRAIADNEEPTSGFMYREMAQWTFKDYNTQMKFIDALLEKLKPNSGVHVLYKILRIIKVMCETGHSDFQKEMQKNSRTEEIKAFTMYRGKPDANHGDSLNEKVRLAARDAMEAVFSHHNERRLSLATMGYGNNESQNNSYSGVSGGGVLAQPTFTTGHTVTGALLEGPMSVHSNRIAPMPTTNKWAEHVAQQASAANTSITSRMMSALTEKAKTGFGILGNSNVIGQYKSAKDELYENALRLGTTGMNTGSLSSVDTGSFKPPELKEVEPYSSGVEGSSSGWKFIEDSARGGGGGGSSSHETKSSFTFQQQERERVTPFQASVQRICQMKSTPQRVELHTFLSQCILIGEEMMRQRVDAVVDGSEQQECWEELAEALDTQLTQQHPWQRRLNALVAIEALILPRNGDAHWDETIATMMRQSVVRYFLENPEDVQRNVSVVQATLRERAQRVLKLLGLPESDANNTMTVDSDHAGAVGTAGQTFTWSTPTNNSTALGMREGGVSGSTAERDTTVDMSGMAFRAAHRGIKDKTTLKKRAPMHFVDDGVVNTTCVNNSYTNNNNHNHNNINCGNGSNPNKMNNTSGTGNIALNNAIIGNMNSNNMNNNYHKSAGGNDVLDELFGSPATTTTTTTTTTTRTAPITSVNDGSTPFDFLKVTGVEASTPFVVSPSLPSSMGGSLPSTDVNVRNIIDDNNKNENAILSGNGFNTFPIPTSSLPNTTTTTSTSTAPTFAGPSSAMLLQMQQQLQVLMNNLQNNQSPDALAQIQSLVEKQQNLMTLISQQQQQQQHALWDTSSYNSVSGSGGSALPVHNHFSMGVVHSSSSTSSSSFPTKPSNSLADVQREMMSHMATFKQGQ